MNTRKTALITGASSGIGVELARIFSRNGFDLILTARRAERLERLASQLTTHSTVIAGDLAEADAPRKIYEQIQGDQLRVDCLVNNAGFGGYGRFEEQSLQHQMAMLRVNVMALTELTHLILPQMIERRRGFILNVASMAAFQPGPLMSVYYASKAYVLSFSEGLAEELRSKGIIVTALCPGPVATEFGQVAGIQTFGELERLAVPAPIVAEQAYHGMMAGKRVVIPGWKNRVLAGASKITPRGLAARIVMEMQGTKAKPLEKP